MGVIEGFDDGQAFLQPSNPIFLIQWHGCCHGWNGDRAREVSLLGLSLETFDNRSLMFVNRTFWENKAALNSLNA
jgi:hypothetical protein